MARVIQYVAPNASLAESPRAATAWEQAGRRLGPLANESAQFQREAGTAQAQGIKQQAWPFDIARLYEERAAAATTQTGGTTRLRGGRAGADHSAVSGSHIGLPDNSSDLAGLGQISRGAGALGRALRDGGLALADRTGEAMTLENGELVSSSQAKKLFAELNSKLDKDTSDNTKELVNTRDWWTRYNMSDPQGMYQTNQSQTSSQSYESSLSAPPVPGEPEKGFWSDLSNWIGGAGLPSSTESWSNQ